LSDGVALAYERQERATMREVAALAGVAIKTVSRVFNDVPTVDPALAKRVIDAAEELGYRRNLTASNLRRSDGRTHTIGLLLEDVSNPYSARIHRAVEDKARDRGLLLLAGSLDEDPARERELAKALIDRRVDGLIIIPAGDNHDYVIAEQRAGTSFVFVDRAPVPAVADSVVADNRVGAAAGVSHLMSAGHRRIAYIGDTQTIMTARERYKGYHLAHKQALLSPDPDLIRLGVGTVAAANAMTRELLELSNPPDAIFASQNLVTIGVIEALHELRLHKRIAMVGFDDIPLGAVLDPGVTIVAQDAVAIGQKAAERLFARMDGDMSPPKVFTIPTRLIQRGSGEIRSLRRPSPTTARR
jgi:LacI family transcriptional regulator